MISVGYVRGEVKFSTIEWQGPEAGYLLKLYFQIPCVFLVFSRPIFSWPILHDL